MNKKLDLTKPVQTRDGHAARILCTDRKPRHPTRSEFCIFGLVDTGNGCEQPQSWNIFGHTPMGITGAEIVNVPQTIRGWLNVYSPTCHDKYNTGYVCLTRDQADADACQATRIACIEVEFTEGEGL